MKNLLEDIIISGENHGEHDERLKSVLQQLADHDVVINNEKSAFSVDAVDFVGHRVTSHGVSPLQSHVDSIAKLDTPTNLKELRRFLGAAGFYRKFVPRFSDLVEPLNELLRGETEFTWNEQRQQSFDQIKTALS